MKQAVCIHKDANSLLYYILFNECCNFSSVHVKDIEECFLTLFVVSHAPEFVVFIIHPLDQVEYLMRDLFVHSLILSNLAQLSSDDDHFCVDKYLTLVLLQNLIIILYHREAGRNNGVFVAFSGK